MPCSAAKRSAPSAVSYTHLKILSDSPHVYFVAEGAERFAAEHGIALCRNEDLIIPREIERLREYQAQGTNHGNDLFAPAISHDTVGAVALLSLIHISASGIAKAMP